MQTTLVDLGVTAETTLILKDSTTFNGSYNVAPISTAAPVSSEFKQKFKNNNCKFDRGFDF